MREWTPDAATRTSFPRRPRPGTHLPGEAETWRWEQRLVTAPLGMLKCAVSAVSPSGQVLGGLRGAGDASAPRAWLSQGPEGKGQGPGTGTAMARDSHASWVGCRG